MGLHFRVWSRWKASDLIFNLSFGSNTSHRQTSIYVHLYPGLFSLSIAENPSGLFLQDLFLTVADFLAEWCVTDQSCSFRNVCFGVLTCLNSIDIRKAVGKIIYLSVFWEDVRTSELGPGMLDVVPILKTISCGLDATRWTAVLNLPQNSDRYLFII